jgi:hypothetical protein
MLSIMTAEHVYVSTACHHGLHGSCRQTCKFCDTSCACTQCQHPAPEDAVPWVDQARSLAADLLALVPSPLLAAAGLQRRITDDPDLFWIRGETQPPGHWRQ